MTVRRLPAARAMAAFGLACGRWLGHAAREVSDEWPRFVGATRRIRPARRSRLTRAALAGLMEGRRLR